MEYNEDENVPVLTVDQATAPTKAWVGGVIAGVLAFLAPIVSAVNAGEAVTGAVWLNATVAALVFAGTIFGTVYSVRNRELH